MGERKMSRTLRGLVLGTVVVAIVMALAPVRAMAEQKAWDPYYVEVQSGFLALRTEPADDDANIVGELDTGERVLVRNTDLNKTYWYAYSEKHSRSGWVNRNFLVRAGNLEYYRVRVASGFLALRVRAEDDDENIIGELYTGDVVRRNDKRDFGGYWFVYSPKIGEMGYVNKNFLVRV